MMRIKLNTIDDVSDFIEIVNKYEGNVDVKSGRMVFDGKSIVSLFGLGLSKPLDIHMISHKQKECDCFYNEIERWRV